MIKDNVEKQELSAKAIRYARRKSNPVSYNKTQVHRFPAKPYIKIPAHILAGQRAEKAKKRDERAERKRTLKFVLMESKQLKQVQVVTDTLLIERARSMVDATYVDPIKWLRDNQEEDKDSG